MKRHFSAILKRPTLSTEALVTLVAMYVSLVCNGQFWTAIRGEAAQFQGGVGFVVATLCIVICGQSIIFALLSGFHTVKPILSFFIVLSVIASYFMTKYTVYLNVSMIRNLFETDLHEASDLVTFSFFTHLLLSAVLPVALVWWVKLKKVPLWAAVRRRVVALLVAVGLLGGCLWAYSDEYLSFFNREWDVRHLITPANLVVSAVRVVEKSLIAPAGPRIVIGGDAIRGSRLQASDRPVLFVFVLGETARSRSFSLNGYERPTNPCLETRNVISFHDVTACGTSTAESLPCMFSKFPRSEYSDAKGKRFETVLDIVDRAGFRVVWRDNNSGCKGLCDGFETTDLRISDNPELCSSGECWDEILLDGLDAVVDDSSDMFVVLHQAGSHGPAYSHRYPPAFNLFTPACDGADLPSCSHEEVINAYDNTILYTDYVLDRIIAFLESRSGDRDTALIYVSDHGESTGAHGVFLHGMPFRLAPEEQKRVPLIVWLSPSFARRFDIDPEILRSRADQPISHDYLFHTVLGMLDIETSELQPDLDFSH